MLLVDDLSSGKYMLLEQCSLLMGFFYIFIVVSEVGGKKEAERKEDMGVIRESEEILCIQGRKTEMMTGSSRTYRNILAGPMSTK